MQSTRYFYSILMKSEFSRQFFEKYSIIKYHGNPSTASWVVPYGRQTDVHDELSLFAILRTYPNTKNYDRICVCVRACLLNTRTRR